MREVSKLLSATTHSTSNTQRSYRVLWLCVDSVGRAIAAPPLCHSCESRNPGTVSERGPRGFIFGYSRTKSNVPKPKIRLIVALICVAPALASCLASEEPLSPDKALILADQHIERILDEERRHNTHSTTATRKAPAETVDASEVVVWHFTHPIMNQLTAGRRSVRTFQDKHPGVRLRTQYIGDWPVAIQKLAVSLAADDLPDVALVKRSMLARLIASGRLAKLDLLLPRWLLEDIRPEFQESFTVDGHVYALPADGFCSVLYINRNSIPDKTPATWSELEDTAREFDRQHPAKGGVTAIGHYPFIEALWSAGGRVCDEHMCDLDTVCAKKALDFVKSVRAPENRGRAGIAFESFMSGKVAMTVASTDRFRRARSDCPFKFDLAPVPGLKGPVSKFSDNALVVFAGHAAPRQAAIAAVLDFLTGRDIQGRTALDYGSAPVRSSVAEVLAVPAAIELAVSTGRNTPLIPAWGAIRGALDRHLDRAYRWRPPLDRPRRAAEGH